MLPLVKRSRSPIALNGRKLASLTQATVILAAIHVIAGHHIVDASHHALMEDPCLGPGTAQGASIMDGGDQLSLLKGLACEMLRIYSKIPV